MTTERILNYLKANPTDAPRLVLDLDVVRKSYETFRALMPNTLIYYAVKANPHAKVLKLLADLGSYFDCASVQEIEDAMEAGASAKRISYGSTIKKEADIAKAFALGVELYSVDCPAEIDKIARVAPQSKVICRILCDNAGSDWPLSRKFGCEPEEAHDLMVYAQSQGLVPYGVAFHVGSQQKRVEAWDSALASVAGIFASLKQNGIELKLVNLGGGFPSRAGIENPEVSAFAKNINASLKTHFGNDIPLTIIEPGRGMVADAGVIETEVVLISEKNSDTGKIRWVYLDIGKFGGLAETMDESIRYPIVTAHEGDVMVPCVLAGPTCDSADVMYERVPFDLPQSLQIGEKVLILSAGAYTSTYSAVNFNGFPALAEIVL